MYNKIALITLQMFVDWKEIDFLAEVVEANKR